MTVNPTSCKTKFAQTPVKLAPFNKIVRLHHIYLESKIWLLSMLLADSVEALECNQSIVCNQSFEDKSALVLRNNVRQKHLGRKFMRCFGLAIFRSSMIPESQKPSGIDRSYPDCAKWQNTSPWNPSKPPDSFRFNCNPFK